MLIGYWSDTYVSDRYLIHIDPRVFAIWAVIVLTLQWCHPPLWLQPWAAHWLPHTVASPACLHWTCLGSSITRRLGGGNLQENTAVSSAQHIQKFVLPNYQNFAFFNTDIWFRRKLLPNLLAWTAVLLVVRQWNEFILSPDYSKHHYKVY